MSKVLIIESCENKVNHDFSDTNIVHVRNSVILKNILNCDMISHESEIVNVINNFYDVIICMYASHYMFYKKYIAILDKNNNAKMFWFVNEHGLGDNILLRNYVKRYSRGYDVISNNIREGFKQGVLNTKIKDKTISEWVENWYTVNVNCLIFDENANRKNQESIFTTEKIDCIYYGTFRPNRVEDMKDYNSLDYVISASTKNHKKYMQSGIKARYVDKLNWTIGYEDLYNYKYSMYFEDIHTHTSYEYMANRFYECLMCEVLLFFDYRCKNTIKKSEYKIDEYMIVKNGAEVKEKIKEINSDNNLYKDLLHKQNLNKEIVSAEQKKTIKQIKEIVNKKIVKPEMLEIPETELVDNEYF